ncbi:MAG TPA: hypothetical protein ENI80_03565 [Acidiferrobacteraceae bacterium]|nr:hypothetical protein [Acidiferrobacteraceae bacterium]
MAIQKLLLAKKEVTRGTDPTPTGANIIETEGLEMLRYEGNRVQRNIDRNLIGNTQQINVDPHTVTSFAVAAAGSGTAVTPAQYGLLLLACGMDETIDATPGSENVTYQHPVNQSDLRNADSITLYDYRPEVSQLQKSSGVEGTVAFAMQRGELPKFNFSNLMGSYVQPAQATPPTGLDWSAWKDPLPPTKDNVPVFTVDGFSSCTEQFNIDFAMQVIWRDVPGCQRTLLLDYNPTGQVIIQAPDIATKNFWQKLESHSVLNKIVVGLQMGNTAGQIVMVDSAEVQISNIKEQESDGMMVFAMDLLFLDRPIITTK